MFEDPAKITYFALTNSRGKELPFGIKRKDRARHMYVIGKTGMGKSTLLENMAIQDIRNGEGMAFIDPHGSTAERLLEYVPEHRKQDVLYFAPFDMEHPVAFNVMEDVGYDKRHLVVSGLLSAFRKIWVDAWSARMEYILSNTLLALLEYEGATLLDVNRMLVNKEFRKKVIANITDPIVKSFWAEEFAAYSDRYTQEATPSIQNKIGQFTSNPLIRNIVGQPNSSFDIRQMMDDKKIIIINLSKGKVGEVNATLLGSMLVTKIYLAAMSRADVSAATLEGLPSFYFYVDEFQTFANQSFADILSEARKYKLNLIIAHQYIEQMEEEVRNAVFGNVGTTVAFRVGPFDAEVLETVFSPQFTKEDLVNLGFAQIYLTLMIDGVGSQPFSATTMPPFELPPKRFLDEVIGNSRRTYGKPRVEVEDAITKWQAAEHAVPNPAPAPAYGARPRPAASASASTPRPPEHFSPRPAAPARPPQPAASAPVRPPEPPARTAAPARPAPPAPRPQRSEPARSSMPKPETERSFDRTQDRPFGRTEDRPFDRTQDRPQLEGTNSLKEALSRLTGGAAAVEKETRSAERSSAEMPKPRSESVPSSPKADAKGEIDLKSVLRKIAPEPNATASPAKPAQEQPARKEESRKDAASHRAPAELPEDVLRDMLRVENDDTAR